MFLNATTVATICLCAAGVAFACPVLVQGFKRRGTGVKYETSFLVQRAPQYVSLAALAAIFICFIAFNSPNSRAAGQLLLTIAYALPPAAASGLSWLGLVIQLSGFIFMVGGWYNLGEYFSTDVELLNEHKVKSTGLFAYVMHPIYSGIIQTLFGLAVTSLSPLSVGLVLFLVAPLWLNRARYEESLLTQNLGKAYRRYGDKLRWRRIVPLFLPFGF